MVSSMAPVPPVAGWVVLIPLIVAVRRRAGKLDPLPGDRRIQPACSGACIGPGWVGFLVRPGNIVDPHFQALPAEGPTRSGRLGPGDLLRGQWRSPHAG